MLEEFLRENRDELIERCRARVVKRRAPGPTPAELQHGVPVFLDQLIEALSAEIRNAENEPAETHAGGRDRSQRSMSGSAAKYGRALFEQGVLVDQAIRGYGDLCQAITELATEKQAPIEAREFRMLNGCLDDAIADAVTDFARERDLRIADRSALESNERIGVLAHEMRNFLNTAMLAQSVIKAGTVGPVGATGNVLDRSLIGLRDLIDRSLSEVRSNSEAVPRIQAVSVARFIEGIRASAILEANSRDLVFDVPSVDPSIYMDIDENSLASAVGNVLQNAFKFTRPHSEVDLVASASADEVFITVADRCGGLPAGFVERAFVPFTQAGGDRSGVGLGLTIARRAVEDNGGAIELEDIPGTGCVVRIRLRRSQALLQRIA